ncbi:hypothetical protein CRG98_007750 [Punica granatum]|uniref:Uncharacterized protein n=1 Tax=Punica granatum TaxID=22663 RepID=A0A2I0KTU1_PUNGR|nr:hypothetical protein CRG98_007750 [Punica granatum]
MEDAGDLSGGVGVANWWPSTLNRLGTSSWRSPFGSGLGSPIGNPDPSIEVVGVLCECRRPWWRGQGRRLAAPTPNLPETSDSESPVDSGLGLPIGDSDPSIEAAGVLCGYGRPQWRGRGRRLVALISN